MYGFEGVNIEIESSKTVYAQKPEQDLASKIRS